MLERQELEEHIAEIVNKRDQSVSEIRDLAAFIIARDDLSQNKAVGSYGDAAPATDKTEETIIGNHGTSEFLQVIAGKDAGTVWKVIDETMDTLKLMEPRLYAGVLRKLEK